jgi:hypothetical protein
MRDLEIFSQAIEIEERTNVEVSFVLPVVVTQTC